MAYKIEDNDERGFEPTDLNEAVFYIQNSLFQELLYCHKYGILTTSYHIDMILKSQTNITVKNFAWALNNKLFHITMLDCSLFHHDT